MKELNIRVYYSHRQEPLDKYYIAYALDEDDNLVWVSNYETDDPVLLDEIDEWYYDCVHEIPDFPKPLHKWDYQIDYNNKRYIGTITLSYELKEKE